jgi:hypothetical protein
MNDIAIPEHVRTGRVILSQSDVDRANDEGVKLAGFMSDPRSQRNRFNDGPMKQERSCVVGRLGEIALARYFGIEPRPFVNRWRPDGGSDLEVPGIGRIQIKTQGPDRAGPGYQRWIVARAKDVVDGCDYVVGAIVEPMTDPVVVSMTGVVTLDEWRRLKRPATFGTRLVGIPQAETHPLHELWWPT